MLTLKLTAVGNSVGIVLPKEALERLNLEKGDKIFLTESWKVLHAVLQVEESVVLALHEEHLEDHGGAVGIRDRGLLESALFRPQNLAG